MFSDHSVTARYVKPKTIVTSIIVVLLFVCLFILFMAISVPSGQKYLYVGGFVVIIGVIVFLESLSNAEVFGIEVPSINNEEEVVIITSLRGKFKRYASSHEWKWPFDIMRKYYSKFSRICYISVDSKLFSQAKVYVSGNIDIRSIDFLLRFADGRELNNFIEEEVKDFLDSYTIYTEDPKQDFMKKGKEKKIKKLLNTSFEKEEILASITEVEIKSFSFK